MCGIAGFLSQIPCDKGDFLSTFQQMTDTLHHRGPDDNGIWINKNKQVGLGHTRLSILDLSSNAHQPMSNEACPECNRRNGSIWITYNGEIYNFREIRSTLEKKGHVFKSNSDTEVVIHSYEEWDKECLQRFSGMFAFALWDENNKKFFLARDRIGKKPLFYYRDSELFAFASELRALLTLDIPKNINISGIHQYLTYQYIPAPQSAFKNIFKIPPAHYLLCEKGKISVERYWDIDFSQKMNVSSERDLSEDVFQKLKESVRMRLISDVPYGAFLSGGIDSSIIVALMSELMEEPVKTFSIGFEEDLYNELPYARQIAHLFKTDHKEFIVKFNALDVLPKLVRHYGEPFADSSALPTFYLSKMTSEFVKVALSGDGGDENFAGYDRYYALKLMSWFRRLPKAARTVFLKLLNIYGESDLKSRSKRLKRFIQGSLYPENLEYFQWMTAFSKNDMEDLYAQPMLDVLMKENPHDYLTDLFKRSTSKNNIESAMDVDIHSYLPFDLLVKVDIASMANSLEVRCPFLDHTFMEYTASIPFEFKLNRATKKYILKKTFNGIIPEEIFQRQKAGFGVPIARWFRQDLRDYVSDILLSRRFVERGYFRQDAVQKLISDHISGIFDNSYKIWALLMLELWHREFIDA
jgi:asparagine synthase (glutamine-hydrolysing)